MKTARRCAVATFPKLWPPYATPRLACFGGQAIRTLQQHAVGWLPSRYRRWRSSGLKWKTKWPCLDTFVVVEGSGCFTRSDAALRVAQHLAGGWTLLRVLSLIPKPMRDWGYTVMARHRYQWFGRRETCMIPSRDILDRFLQ